MNQYLYAKSYGNKVFIKEIRDGNRNHIKTDRLPLSLYEQSLAGGYRSVTGTRLKRHEFNDIPAMKDYADTMKGMSNYVIAGMKDPAYQYINTFFPERDLFDPDRYNKAYFDIETERDPAYGYAAPSNPCNPVTLIQIKYRGKIIIWGDKDYTPKDKNVEFRLYHDDILMIENFFQFVNHQAIDILSGWNVMNYDIPYLCGRYLGQFGRHETGHLKQYKTWSGMDNIFPFGMVKKSVARGMFGKDEVRYDIVGIEILDYLDLYKKFTYKTPENYKLNTIASIEIDRKKVDYSEHKHLEDLYENDYEKFIEYGIEDVVLIEELDAKLKLMDIAISIAYMAGCNPSDVFSPVKTWEIFLYNKMIKENVITPWSTKQRPRESYVGAFVREPMTGRHDWVISLDLASLYPHCYRELNMSIETLVSDEDLPVNLAMIRYEAKEDVVESIEKVMTKGYDLAELKEHDLAMAPNGAFFRRDVQGIIPRILGEIYTERKEVKGRMLGLKQDLEDLPEKEQKTHPLKSEIAKLNGKQMALKIMMNSLYGASGNPYFSMFSLDIAEGITSFGQVAIKFIADKMNEFLNSECQTEKDRVVYGDTDSIFLSLADIVTERITAKNKNLTDDQIATIIDKYCEAKIQPFIDDCYEELREYLNGYEQAMVMKREKIARSMVLVSKKRYFVGVIDDEGVRYIDLKLKTTGLESVRVSTPKKVKKALEKLQRIILTDTEQAAGKFIEDFKSEFMTYSIGDISIPKSVNGIEKWSDNGRGMKGSPQQVKAALLFNRIILKKDKLADKIQSGDKINLVAIRSSKKFDHETTIAFPGIIPEELGLCTNDVDYEEMFRKTFLSPAENIMKSLNWSATKPMAANIMDFFA